MEKRNKVALGSAIGAALATSALVAGMAFAAPSTPVAPATVPTVAAPAAAAPVAAEPVATEAAATAVDGDNVQDQSGADDATEAKSSETSGEKESATAETDGIDHQFEGNEVGNNGNGVPDANESAETK